MLNRFNVADLNAIETRVGAWLAGCQPFLDVFTTFVCADHPESSMHLTPGKYTLLESERNCKVCHDPLEQMCPYLSFATKMYNIPYFTLAKDYHSKIAEIKAAAKEKRQIAKPGVLAGFYRQGPGGWGKDKNGDPKKLGLWAYAENMGVKLTLEQCQEITRVFRSSYTEVVSMWYALEIVVRSVLEDKPITTQRPDMLFAINRLNELGIKFDKITITDRGAKRTILRMNLPAGRALHYMDAEIDEIKMPWTTDDGGEVYKPSLVYSGLDQETKVWKCGITSHGGKLFENGVQGIARDVLADKLLEFEKHDLPVCLHVHDEGGSETPNDPFWPGVREMVNIMSQPVSWALTLPLGADGFEDSYYHK